ncbi:putative repeat protein (TIGR02543 family) [Breznakia blatticola]|uniref:Putative repeat protein (TIGR02543 family) n=2 Tax=Breznakia blatticola TaxID=1754012 RepID=A0A4R7ZQS8_9FIRM|nr:putative repeat protein (TIGR02543 family) [Breznakia blatticola]
MIYTIALGENSIFSGWDTLLTENWMSPTPSWRTERWIGLTTGNVYNDSDEFMENYDGSIPDTYQWEYLVSINFDLNGGDRNPLISTKTINQLSTVSSIIKDIPNPTKKGHEFLGWEIVGDLAWDMETTTPHGYASSNDLNIEEMATTPINLKAKWKAKEYNIIYNLDGGENATTNPTGYTYGVGVKSFEEPTKEGHTFLGWYSDADFTTEVTSISETQLEDVILYAKWKANDYTINYELDGGANTSENPLGYTFGVGVKAFKAPTKVGFTFEGWYSDADFTTEVTNISETQMEDVTLYAKWELNRYTITYELDGGENHKDNSAGFAFGEGVEKLEEPTKAGYTFLGWFDAQTGGNEVVKIAKERNEDITLYARWKQNPQEPIVNPDKDKENPTENTPNDNNTVINADESDNGSTTENVVNNPNVAPEFNGSTANVSGSVQTGDETNIMTLYVLLGLALLSGGMITRRKLKK